MSIKTFKTIIAVPAESIAVYLETQMHKMLPSRSRVIICQDLYNLIDLLKSEQPEIAIISPCAIGDLMLPYLKDRFGLNDTKFVAYCDTQMGEMMVRNYDAKLLLSDHEKEIKEVIDHLIASSGDENEEVKENALTPREKDIVVCVVKGLTNKEIAAELFLSTHTVITHRRNIAKKLQIHSPAGLTIYAIVNKLVELSDIKDM